MIAFIKGIIHSYNKDSLIIENNGIVFIYPIHKLFL